MNAIRHEFENWFLTTFGQYRPVDVEWDSVAKKYPLHGVNLAYQAWMAAYDKYTPRPTR